MPLCLVKKAALTPSKSTGHRRTSHEGRTIMFRYCTLIMVVLISLFYGCSSSPITEETNFQELTAAVRHPNIESNNARFFHENQKYLVSIRYRNSGPSPAYRVITDLKIFLDALMVPIEKDAIEFEPTLVPKAVR